MKKCTGRTVTGMAEYIEKHKTQMVLCMLPAELDAEAVQRCIEAVHNLPAADVRENVIRTQADRIRAMSDEELAAWLDELVEHNWLDWLKQEVEL